MLMLTTSSLYHLVHVTVALCLGNFSRRKVMLLQAVQACVHCTICLKAAAQAGHQVTSWRHSDDSLGQHHAGGNPLAQETTEHACQTVLQELDSQTGCSAQQAILAHTRQGGLEDCAGNLLKQTVQPCRHQEGMTGGPTDPSYHQN